MQTGRNIVRGVPCMHSWSALRSACGIIVIHITVRQLRSTKTMEEILQKIYNL